MKNKVKKFNDDFYRLILDKVYPKEIVEKAVTDERFLKVITDDVVSAVIKSLNELK